MPTTATSPADQALASLLSAADPADIAGVIARMQAIDAILPANDGLKWFNQLYLMVTQQVDLNPPGGAWQNPQWLLGLDVIFADYYFSAIREFLAGQIIPSAWSALFEARFRSGIDRIQFAVAGMNAHINRDLALALLDTDSSLNLLPAPDGPEHADYQSINTLLQTVMPAALNMLAGDILGLVAEDTGNIGRLLAFWDICRARDLAWDFAGHLRGLNSLVRDAALVTQDAMTGALGRAILAVRA
ncbi:MAG TPA: DUF5995 family protein [Terracidiphilus sp.]|jgi:hypothetical protein|nr:DUF5995 family protein [Terracidiphilus sp.]